MMGVGMIQVLVTGLVSLGRCVRDRIEIMKIHANSLLTMLTHEYSTSSN